MNLVKLRNFLGVATKLKENIFKNNNQIESTVTTRTRVLPTGWTRVWPVTGLVSKWRNSGSPHLLEWLDVVLQGARILYRINKDKDDGSLPFLVFWRHIVNAIFLKYSKEGRLFSSHVGIRNIPSDVCYDVTKHYQVQSEHSRT